MIKKIIIAVFLIVLINPTLVQAQGTSDLESCSNQGTRYCQGDTLYDTESCAKRCDLENPPGLEPSKCRCICVHNPVGVCKEGQPVVAPWEGVIGTINAPKQVKSLGFGAGGLSKFFTNIITIIYVFAGIIFVFMIIMGAVQWIVSGGDKDAITKARQRIVNAIIGLALLAVTFLIVSVIGQVTGFTLFTGQSLP